MANGYNYGGFLSNPGMLGAGLTLLTGGSGAQAGQQLAQGQALQQRQQLAQQQLEQQKALAAQRIAIQQAAQNAAQARHQQMMDWRREQFAAGAPLREAQLGLAQARAADYLAQAGARQRQAGNIANIMSELEIDPQSPEGIALRTTGKLPAEAYKSIAQRYKKGEAGPRLAAGLRDIQEKARAAEEAGSLEAAIGPMQGAEPTSLLGAVPINIARTLGWAGNIATGGKMSPTQVRSHIQGATEAIAASVKPLIRAPGEGVWTDKDQERLVAMVGNLAQARNLREFNERLNSLRDRVQTNFGIEVPFEAFAPPAPPAAAVQQLRQDTSAAARREFDAIFGQGAAERALRGR